MIRRIISTSQDSLLFFCKYHFIRNKDLTEIKSKYGQTKYEKLKMNFNLGKHIIQNGVKNVLNDANNIRDVYLKLAQRKQLTPEEQAKYDRFRLNLERLKPVAVINALPFSGPLLLLFMHVYPGSIPTWFCIDQEYDAAMRERIKKQSDAIQYFKAKGTKKQDIDLKKLSLDELKKLSELLIGFYADGTHGLRKLRKNYTSPHFVHQNVSRWMVIRKMKIKMNIELKHKPISSSMPFQDYVRWRFEEVMEGRMKLSYVPLTQSDAAHTPQAQSIQNTTKIDQNLK